VRIRLALCVFLLLGPAGSTQSKVATLNVVIELASGFSTNDCKVFVYRWEWDSLRHPSHSEVAKSEGAQAERHFELSPGFYQLFVTCPTTQPLAKEIKLEANRETKSKFKLRDSKAVRYIE